MALEIKKGPTRSHGLLRGIINWLATCFPTVALFQRSHSTHQNLKVDLSFWPSIISTLCTWLFILYLISLQSFPSSLPNHNTTNSGNQSLCFFLGLKCLLSSEAEQDAAEWNRWSRWCQQCDVTIIQPIIQGKSVSLLFFLIMLRAQFNVSL